MVLGNVLDKLNSKHWLSYDSEKITLHMQEIYMKVEAVKDI